MIAATIILEDTVIIAERGERDWRMTLSDSFTGKVERLEDLSDLEAGAIIGLAIGGDELEGKSLYSIAEPKVKDLSKECRPIP